MASNATWLKLANKLFNKTFAGQTKNTIVLTRYGASNPNNPVGAVLATDTITVARVYDFSNYEAQAIGAGVTDKKVAFVNNPLSCEINQSLSITVNGDEMNLVNVSKDEAGAVWTLHVSVK